MKRYMMSIFRRVESGVYVQTDSEQLCLEIKDLTARIALLLDIKDQAFTIHVHEKTLDEYAATVCTMQKRIEKLEQHNAALQAEVDDLSDLADCQLTEKLDRHQQMRERVESRLRKARPW